MSTGALLSGDDVTADDVTCVALMTNADSLEYSSKILSSIFTRILYMSNRVTIKMSNYIYMTSSVSSVIYTGIMSQA